MRTARLFALSALSVGLLAGAQSAMAYEAGDFIIKGGSATVDPQSKATSAAAASADNDTQLGLSFTYMATPRLGIEVLAATPFDHDIQTAYGADTASTKHLPPTVTANFYPMGESNAAFQPFAGIGFNYTFFWDEEGHGDALGGADVDLDDSWGIAYQLGADYMISDNLGLGASVYYVDIDTDLTVGGADYGTVELDPWVYRLNAVFKF
ncbi:hypothetical protein BFW38_01635 [Terasakiispira papahanaumokuakeensis]|uniref:Outer membrane protein OmpW n=1 Tax=Terasakiispira papahanaumokuakeensis TaxID=197479 RepID=A0A1E2V6G3_9GAMM|nr:OmpW family outer membrane protein [Terasakiispira papahanaumokuakeensis]ODC02436.1 hypothetical protein BFW38_01635 [Terasakiispira papahanaumokuakeensis]